MEEKLYTVPVNDAFDLDTECPVCALYDKLENDAIEFMMGPSYMEDDIRMETNRLGFCKAHLRMLLEQRNRLGLSLILKTHLDRQAQDCSEFVGKKIKPRALLKKDESPIGAWARKTTKSCYICERIEKIFPHYLGTILYLYKKEPEFVNKYKASKGFCQEHLADLIETGRGALSGDKLQEFCDTTIELYLNNIKRVSQDLDWFANKFDYRYKDAPWKNSRDAIERAAVKTNGIPVPENKENKE